MAKSNALKVGMLGALLGGLKFKLDEHNRLVEEQAQRIKEERLRQIQLEAEARQNAEWERRNSITHEQDLEKDDRDFEQDLTGKAIDHAYGAERDERNFGQQRQLQGERFAHSDAQLASTQQNQRDMALMNDELARGRLQLSDELRNDTDQAVTFMAEGPSGQQQLVTLQPGQKLNTGWRMLTTEGARSPMPSATKGVGGYMSPRAGGQQQALLPQGPKPRSWEGWSGTEID